MSVKPDVYQVQKARSLKTIIECSKQKKNESKFGVIRHPLLMIEVAQVLYRVINAFSYN